MAFFNPKSVKNIAPDAASADEAFGISIGGYPAGFLIRNAMDVLSFSTNLFVLSVLYAARQDYRCSFYLIMTIFMIMTMVVSFFSIIYCITSSINEKVRSSDDLARASIIMDYFNSFYSVVLISVMVCDRCCILVYPRIHAMLFQGKVFPLTLVISALTTVILTFFVADASQTTRMYDPTTGMVFDYAEDPGFVSTVNNIFYVIPLLTSVFFVRIYMHLQQIKKDTILGKTKMMVDNAEVSNCRQAFCVVGSYSICLIVHFVLAYVEPGKVQDILMMVERCVASLPQFFLPASLIICSPKIRKSIKVCICCSKENVRIGSATSTTNSRKILPSFRLSLPNLSSKI